MRRAAIGAWMCVVGLWAGQVLAAAPDAPAPAMIYDVPRLSGIGIDGKADDWGRQGFRIGAMADLSWEIRSPGSYAITCRLGWDERGLLILAEVSDDIATEADTENYWDGDALELYFSRLGKQKDMYQVTVSPGVSPKHAEPRMRVMDHRLNTGTPIRPQVARTTRNGAGYVMEVLMPWDAFGVAAQVGQQYQLQVQGNDWDRAGGPGERSVWFPSGDSWNDPRMAHRIRLSETASEPSVAVASAAWHHFRRLRVPVATAPELVGKTLELRSGERRLGSAVVSQRGGGGQAILAAPIPPQGQPYGPLMVFCEDKPVAFATASDIDRERLMARLEAELRAEPYVMRTGSALPTIDYANPERAEDALGAYRIETTFYDKDYNVVTAAEKPGRYGAVVRIIPEQGGAPMTRFMTLFRWPEGMRTDVTESNLTWRPPPALGIDPALLAQYGQLLEREMREAWSERLFTSPSGPVVLAALTEARVGDKPLRLTDTFSTSDRQWWVNLKRKQYGLDQQSPNLPPIPWPIEGTPAPVLREGTAQEAGMRPDVVQKMDSVCQEWLKTHPVPFTVVAARNGVIFFQKPYGTRNDGQPIAMTQAFPLASISKFVCGTMFMSMVDRGLVSLDDPIEKHLPPLREVASSTGKRITFRHLFTHTAGLQGHWGEVDEDLEYRIAELYPTLQVGQRHEYQGVGYELTGKVMELLSGQAMPLLYRRCLIEPLGLENSDLMYMAWGCEMSAPDLAKVAQLHLNNGAYGPWRFMSEKTMAAMRPKLLTDVLGPGTDKVWGIGNEPFAQEGGSNAPPQEKVPGLSASTYGHGSATGCVIRVDPEHQIIVVMVRPATNWGDHEKWVARFIAAVRDSIAEAADTAVAQ